MSMTCEFSETVRTYIKFCNENFVLSLHAHTRILDGWKRFRVVSAENGEIDTLGKYF